MSMDDKVGGAIALHRRSSYISTAAVIATASIFGLTYSLTAPLIALQLAQRGYGEFYIGLNAAMHAVGVLLIAPVLPGLAVRFGARDNGRPARVVSPGPRRVALVSSPRGLRHGRRSPLRHVGNLDQRTQRR
jgi:hypothetical protein